MVGDLFERWNPAFESKAMIRKSKLFNVSAYAESGKTYSVKKIRIHLRKVADNNTIESKKGRDCHVKEI